MPPPVPTACWKPSKNPAKIIREFKRNPDLDVITPVHQLTWQELDALREAKKTTPLSGTTVTIDKNGNAMWFSKTIIPVLREEPKMRADKLSPVYQHIGLYGYSIEALEKFCSLPQGYYEKLEGLEQLRLLENGISIRTVSIKDAIVHSGIDSPEDLARAQIRLVK
jgi:3-deoxy-manno-octulosonate cytidylyltransferase (CMP-KDO synthetase)